MPPRSHVKFCTLILSTAMLQGEQICHLVVSSLSPEQSLVNNLSPSSQSIWLGL